MPQSANRIRTAQIGEELARLIRNSVPSPQLRVVQFGGIERIAMPPQWDELLPAVFVEPIEATYAGLDASGTESLVTEQYRIFHFFGYAPTEDILAIAAKNLAAILKPLTDDAGLSDLRARISADRSIPGFTDQMQWSSIQAVEWHPEEQQPLTDAQQRVRLVALRWQVQWLNRMQ